ncbi:MAG: alpha/beta hydrolase fold domain-containing protein [Prevotella sp.]
MKRLKTLAIALISALVPCLQAVGDDFTDIDYAGDGLTGHRLDIHTPSDGKDRHKVIILIYGSAWYADNAKGDAYNTMGKALSDAGFAVVSINHRSSREACFPAQINDVKAAIRFVRANAGKYGLDTSFIGITGYSSGGHLASLAGVTNGVTRCTEDGTSVEIEGNVGNHTGWSSRVDAVVDWFGPADMTRMEQCRTVKDAQSPEAALIGGAPAEHFEMTRLLSPITYADKCDTPFLLFHGDADGVVPHCQSVFFAERLKAAGCLADFVTVEGGGHGPVTFNESTFKRMTDFFLLQSNNNR